MNIYVYIHIIDMYICLIIKIQLFIETYTVFNETYINQNTPPPHARTPKQISTFQCDILQTVCLLSLPIIFHITFDFYEVYEINRL